MATEKNIWFGIHYLQKPLLSVVRQTLTEEELEKCYKIADELGVTLKVRDYISKDDNT